MESKQENKPKAEKDKDRRSNRTTRNNKRADRVWNQMTAPRFQTANQYLEIVYSSLPAHCLRRQLYILWIAPTAKQGNASLKKPFHGHILTSKMLKMRPPTLKPSANRDNKLWSAVSNAAERSNRVECRSGCCPRQQRQSLTAVRKSSYSWGGPCC